MTGASFPDLSSTPPMHEAVIATYDRMLHV